MSARGDGVLVLGTEHSDPSSDCGDERKYWSNQQEFQRNNVDSTYLVLGILDHHGLFEHGPWATV
jgi:hypothetical protein